MESLSDPTRLRLLRLLERHELGVAELCEILQLPQSTVSRHLKVLSDQAWTGSRRQGTAHLYRTILDELDSAARRLWLLAREQTDDWATVQQDELRLVRLLRDRQKDSQAFFAGAASQWDKLRGELYGDLRYRIGHARIAPTGVCGGRPGLRDRPGCCYAGRAGEAGHWRRCQRGDAQGRPEARRRSTQRGTTARRPRGGTDRQRHLRRRHLPAGAYVSAGSGIGG